MATSCPNESEIKKKRDSLIPPEQSEMPTKIYLKSLMNGAHPFMLKTFLSVCLVYFSHAMIEQSRETLDDNWEILDEYINLKIICSTVSVLLLYVELTSVITISHNFRAMAPDEELRDISDKGLFKLHLTAFFAALLSPGIFVVCILSHIRNVILWFFGQPWDYKHEMRWWTRLSFVADVVQVYMLIVLTVIVTFLCETPIDIFVNIVAVQMFSRLDDETVRMWFQRDSNVIEISDLYFSWKTENGDEVDFGAYYKELRASHEKRANQEAREWVDEFNSEHQGDINEIQVL